MEKFEKNLRQVLDWIERPEEFMTDILNSKDKGWMADTVKKQLKKERSL